MGHFLVEKTAVAVLADLEQCSVCAGRTQPPLVAPAASEDRIQVMQARE